MQVLQICGAILILIAYALGQMGRMDQTSKPYLLLEGAWVLISVYGLTKAFKPPKK